MHCKINQGHKIRVRTTGFIIFLFYIIAGFEVRIT